MNKLSLVVASSIALVGLSNGVSAEVPAAATDVVGDSLVNLPKDESTVDKSSVDIWFLRIDEATGYSIDLIGTGSDANDCGATAAIVDSANSKTMFLPAAGLDCGQETNFTKPGDSDASLGGTPLHLCKWTTPILADGNYAIAINPITIGGTKFSGTEKKGACVEEDTTPHTTNSHVEFKTGAANADKNYQKFVVKKATTGAGVTQAPVIPEPYLPAAGASLASSSSKLTFTDSSPDAGKASWYELWVYGDKSGTKTRITDYGSNPTYPNWYKLTVDSELSCTENGNAAGDRVCEIEIDINSSSLIGATDTTYSATDTFTWWVKGNNSFGSTGWSTAPGAFIK